MVRASQKLVTAVTRFSTDFLKANHSRWEPPALNDCFGSDEAPMAEVMLPPEKGVGAMTKLDQLHLEKSKKFAEICALVACELGYGELATIESEARHHVEREAEQQITEWEETTELRTRSDIRPITPLRHLLSEYQNICERILDEHEIEVGLWAYKRRSRRQPRPASF